MKSGTEKNPNPHEPSLGKFLRGLCRPATTLRRRTPRPRAEKFIYEPPEPRKKTRPSVRRSKRRAKWLAARAWQEALAKTAPQVGR